MHASRTRHNVSWEAVIALDGTSPASPTCVAVLPITERAAVVHAWQYNRSQCCARRYGGLRHV
ncbi:hypothetical protein [Streptomyces sp. NPDC058683]|uniref:hypothetical protein n=1 Tax=Streptomyces sp. NPDC058683 TaxID=3346597 RepID=UPI0036649360